MATAHMYAWEIFQNWIMSAFFSMINQKQKKATVTVLNIFSPSKKLTQFSIAYLARHWKE